MSDEKAAYEVDDIDDADGYCEHCDKPNPGFKAVFNRLTMNGPFPEIRLFCDKHCEDEYRAARAGAV